MNIARQISTWTFVVLLLPVIWWSGCSLLDSSPEEAIEIPEGDVILVNETYEPLAFAAMELESSHRVDPNPAFDPETFNERRIRGQSARGLSAENISDYERGDDLRLFIYRRAADIGADPGKGYAPLTRILTVRHDELTAREYQVRIDSVAQW